MEQVFCRRCGSSLTPSAHGAYRCENGHLLFSNPAPTVGVFLLDSSGKVLLSVRAAMPNKGKLDTIGGFVDMDETFEAALIREIAEETGLSPADYGELRYLTSAPNDYEYDGEQRQVLSCFYVANLHNHADPQAADDVAELARLDLHDISPEQFGTARDVRAGFAKLLDVVS